MEKSDGLDVRDRLSVAHSKVEFLVWALNSAAATEEVMGSEQFNGLAFILSDVGDVMKEVGKYELTPSELREKLALLTRGA